MQQQDAPDFLMQDVATAAPAQVTAVMLERVAQLCNELLRAQANVETAEEELKRCNKALLKIERVDLPELLAEAGLKSVTLQDGTRVTVDDSFSCGITEAKAPVALQWLRDNGHDAVIKTQVVVSFDKGEADMADGVYLQLCTELGVDRVLEKEAVHPQTLKALLRALRGNGVAVPEDTFSIVPYSIAKVKLKR